MIDLLDLWYSGIDMVPPQTTQRSSHKGSIGFFGVSEGLSLSFPTAHAVGETEH